jgi:hypothetical protein
MNPTSCLFRSWFADNPVFLLAVALLFDEKIRQSAALFWFGLRDVGVLYSRAVIQRTICIFGAHFGGKDRGMSTCNPFSKQEGGWIHFGMKQLRTLNLSNIQDQK